METASLPPAHGRWLIVRLAVLQFLLYAVPGAVIPILSVRLRAIGFTPLEIGWASATQASAALLVPLIAGQVADRWFSAERCLALYASVAGLLLWCLAGTTAPLAFILVIQSFWLVMGPAMTLTTSLCFAHLPDAERDFGKVRLWGTVGWMVTNWLLGYWLSDPAWAEPLREWLRPGSPQSDYGDSHRLAALLSFALAAYALTLPHTPPQPRDGRRRFAPLAALHLLRDPSFSVYFVCLIGISITIPFTSQLTPLFLEASGIPRHYLTPTLTISQTLEVASLALLPMLLVRLGVRGTMLVGIASWLVALAVLTVGQPLWLVVASQGLNGLNICCFMVAGQVFANGRAPRDVRTSAQGLVTFTTGSGLLIGNLLVGWVREITNESFMGSYAVATVLVAPLLVVFYLGFRPSVPVPPRAPANDATDRPTPTPERLSA